MKHYGMFTDAGNRKIDELVNSEDFPTMSFPEVEKKLETLTRLTGPEIEPEPIFGPAGLLGFRKIYEDQCDEMEREATDAGFETFKPFVEATDTVVCEMVYIAWGRKRELHTRDVADHIKTGKTLKSMTDDKLEARRCWLEQRLDNMSRQYHEDRADNLTGPCAWEVELERIENILETRCNEEGETD